MNRNLSLRPCIALAAASGVFGAVSGAQAQFKLFENFEDETPGLIDNQDGWDSAGGDNSVVADPADPGNQVLYVPSSSSTLHKSLLDEGLVVADGDLRMMFMRLRVANKQTFSVGLSHLNSPDEYSDFAPEIGMANSAHNLDLRVWDGDGTTYTNIHQLDADTWYNMWVLVDADSNAYTLWMNSTPGGDGSHDDLLTDENGDDTFDFRAGGSSDLVTFYVRTSGGSSGTNFGPIYIDDIYVEIGDNNENLVNPAGLCVVDFNGDGVLDLADISLFASAFLAGDLGADLNGDEVIDLLDINAFVQLFLAGCP